MPYCCFSFAVKVLISFRKRRICPLCVCVPLRLRSWTFYQSIKTIELILINTNVHWFEAFWSCMLGTVMQRASNFSGVNTKNEFVSWCSFTMQLLLVIWKIRPSSLFRVWTICCMKFIWKHTNTQQTNRSEKQSIQATTCFMIETFCRWHWNRREEVGLKLKSSYYIRFSNWWASFSHISDLNILA